MARTGVCTVGVVPSSEACVPRAPIRPVPRQGACPPAPIGGVCASRAPYVRGRLGAGAGWADRGQAVTGALWPRWPAGGCGGCLQSWRGPLQATQAGKILEISGLMEERVDGSPPEFPLSPDLPQTLGILFPSSPTGIICAGAPGRLEAGPGRGGIRAGPCLQSSDGRRDGCLQSWCGPF